MDTFQLQNYCPVYYLDSGLALMFTFALSQEFLPAVRTKHGMVYIFIIDVWMQSYSYRDLWTLFIGICGQTDMFEWSLFF